MANIQGNPLQVMSHESLLLLYSLHCTSSRHRKELRAIAEEMLRVRLGPKAPVIVLYSLEETHKFWIMC